MPFRLSPEVRNARADAYETAIGASPKLQIFSGAEPANLSDAASGTKLVEMTLPADWLTAGANGVKSKSGTWSSVGLAGAGAGTNAGYYRITNSAGTVTHEQGDVTVTGGGGALTLDNVNIAQNQTVQITTFTKTEGNG